MNKDNLNRIIGLRHELHAHPELSLREGWTKRRLMDFIEENTTLAVVDCGGWFYASRYVEGTRAVAFRADMDALPIPEEGGLPYASQTPGVSHRCGHDGHCAALCGLALELERIERPRSVYLIFQHAEEVGRGAQECAILLPERHVSEVYAFHNRSGYPERAVVVRRGLCQCASKGLTVRMTGRPSHASEPEKGRNPAPALAALAVEAERLQREAWRNMLDEAQRPSQGPGMLLCTVVNLQAGGRDFGISPGEGEVSMTLRADREADMEAFEARIRTKAEELAGARGLKVAFEVSDPFPETVSDDVCVDRVEAAARALGLRVLPMEEPWRASEDFGWYTKRSPGAIFYIGAGEDWPALHTARYDFNDGILETAADLFLEIYRAGLGDA